MGNGYEVIAMMGAFAAPFLLAKMIEQVIHFPEKEGAGPFSYWLLLGLNLVSIIWIL